MSVWSELATGPGGPAGVGSGWTSATAWLVAGVAIVVLAVVAWWIVRPTRRSRRGRGEELALRRYELRRTPPARRRSRRRPRGGSGASGPAGPGR